MSSSRYRGTKRVKDATCKEGAHFRVHNSSGSAAAVADAPTISVAWTCANTDRKAAIARAIGKGRVGWNGDRSQQATHHAVNAHVQVVSTNLSCQLLGPAAMGASVFSKPLSLLGLHWPELICVS